LLTLDIRICRPVTEIRNSIVNTCYYRIVANCRTLYVKSIEPAIALKSTSPRRRPCAVSSPSSFARRVKRGMPSTRRFAQARRSERCLPPSGTSPAPHRLSYRAAAPGAREKEQQEPLNSTARIRRPCASMIGQLSGGTSSLIHASSLVAGALRERQQRSALIKRE
jgi:hypothetical protein